jgi:D-xylose transport system permease protein
MTMLKASPEVPPQTVAEEPNALSTHFRNYFRRLRGGEFGALPAVAGLVVLCTVFSVVRPVFFTAGNLANLLPQGAAGTAIAMGLIFVLLLGEIDLSAGYASGICAAILAQTLLALGFPWYLSLLAALLTGTVIGLVLGTLVAKIGIPSFVVTLAAFLAFQGVVLQLIQGGTIVSITDPVVLAIGNKYLSPALGWAFFAIGVGGYAFIQLNRRRSRIKRKLTADPMSLIALRIGALAVITGAAVFVLNLERSRNPAVISLRGVPVVVPILAVLLVALTFVLKRTRYGLHIYAVGGNTEAARRAGINVDLIRISAFVICSTMAAVGGIISSSRASSVDANTGGSTVLLFAVGAAVIGGTSLFGGKGRILDAVVGGTVIAVINNGLALLNRSSGEKFIYTGLVLLLAAVIDAFSRRWSSASGLR